MSSKRQYFVKKYGSGIGHYYSYISGNGIFTKSLKTLCRYLNQGTKVLFHVGKPHIWNFSKNTIGVGRPEHKLKQSFSPTVSTPLGEKPAKRMKTVKNQVETDILKPARQTSRENCSNLTKTSYEALHGSGLRLSKNSKRKLRRIVET